ncbi:MAG: DUF1178 family protein [Azonexus sp.]|nr:DUF1178 family protein [Azonexus sp.]
MIIYDLCCDNGHRFEGWFQSATDFEAQQERHLICCPQCDTHAVKRVPSAVSIGSHRTDESRHESSSNATSGASTAMMPAGTQAMAMYRQLVQAMVSNCEDVGHSFVEEARKIHYNEAPERPIRGNATEEECEALSEEGIAILRLHNIKEEDLN